MPKFASLPVLSALLGAALCLVSAARAEQPRFPTNEDMRQVRALSHPLLSPDGKEVLVAVNDTTAKGGKSHLWLIDIAANTARQLTESPDNDKKDTRGEIDAAWMPGGHSVLFLAHRGDTTQLFRLPMNGGEAHAYDLKLMPAVDASQEPEAVPPGMHAKAQKATPLPISVSGFSVSPDGKLIAITARDPQTPGEKKQKQEKADAVWVDHDPHGTRLYLLDPATGRLTVTAVPPNVQGVAWNHSGSQLIAFASGMNGLGELHPAGSAWLLRISDPVHPQKLSAIPATVGGGAWSWHDRRFYFLAQSQANTPPGYSDLYVLDFASHAVKNLTASFEGSIGYGDPIATPAGAMQTVQSGVQTTVLAVTGQGNHLLRFPTPSVTQLNTNATHTGWVWLGSGSTTPTTLYYVAKLGDTPKALHAPSILPSAWPQVPSHLVTWKNDGLTLQGLLYLPPQASSTHKVPLIVDIHGGPTGAWQDDYFAFNEFLLGHGWAVFEPNPRGSTGYGASFVAANHNDLGGGDYRDIMTGVDAVIAHDPIDATRLVLMGYSYGGEMAGFVEGKTTRFKAIISGAPVIDQESEYGTESGSWYDRWFYGLPWEHAEAAWRQSPLSFAAHAHTPMLLLQGMADTTDPKGQSEEMYRALRQMGVPVDLVEYPRDNHGPLARAIFGMPSPEPWHGYDARQRIVNFIDAAFKK